MTRAAIGGVSPSAPNLSNDERTALGVRVTELTGDHVESNPVVIVETWIRLGVDRGIEAGVVQATWSSPLCTSTNTLSDTGSAR